MSWSGKISPTLLHLYGLVAKKILKSHVFRWMVNFFVLTLFLIFVVVKDLPKRAGQNMSFMESATEKK